MTIDLVFPPWAHIKESRHDHVRRVASLVSVWADELGVADEERVRWHKAVMLHDALKDAPRQLLDEIASDWWNIPSLRHGPAAAVLAHRSGENDRGVLDAVRYHSVGYANWETVGQILFMADYLESGRDFHDAYLAELSQNVPKDLQGTLLAVATVRLKSAISHHLPLLPETIEFWNSLAAFR